MFSRSTLIVHTFGWHNDHQHNFGYQMRIHIHKYFIDFCRRAFYRLSTTVLALTSLRHFIWCSHLTARMRSGERDCGARLFKYAERLYNTPSIDHRCSESATGRPTMGLARLRWPVSEMGKLGAGQLASLYNGDSFVLFIKCCFEYCVGCCWV